MKLLETILIISTLMWYVIDRLKPAWASVKYGRYITMAAAAAMAAAICVGYRLDIVYALGLSEGTNPIGIGLTVLLYMGGSSAVSEFIAKIKGEGIANASDV